MDETEIRRIVRDELRQLEILATAFLPLAKDEDVILPPRVRETPFE